MEEDDNPYETLDPSSSMATHMLAGAAAGIMEHTVMYPVDCVKTRMQCLVPDPKADYRSVADALRKIVRHEGVRNTVRGFSAMAIGAGPAHALYFACYEKFKHVLSGGKQGNHFAHGCAGCAATLLHDAVMNPADVVKQRMQMYGSPYQSTFLCFRDILRTEGAVAFYRSYTTQLSMNIPFQATQFIMYEIMQDYLNHDRNYDPSSHIVAGAVAGAVAAGITMPLDVCKTLLNTQEHCARTHLTYISGMASAFRTVYEFCGISGFFRGLTARVIYQMPSTAISWSVYEFFKYIISQQRKQPDDRYLSSVHIAAATAR
ncbi:mitoferrin-2 isoform X2 [Aplysia californica]|uniref:Mitoferrin-2 isoform X2 n=1 Tax=Aplysia californica TaxID=6500 RepID=A0ABM0JQX1_APLCA|nr:mitoferrin-2 isoform X2 [Aplysia californica]XP_005099448.1 mitoferrin-2 isoform X2 [Aplysia californica]